MSMLFGRKVTERLDLVVRQQPCCVGAFAANELFQLFSLLGSYGDRRGKGFCRHRRYIDDGAFLGISDGTKFVGRVNWTAKDIWAMPLRSVTHSSGIEHILRVLSIVIIACQTSLLGVFDCEDRNANGLSVHRELDHTLLVVMLFDTEVVSSTAPNCGSNQVGAHRWLAFDDVYSGHALKWTEAHFATRQNLHRCLRCITSVAEDTAFGHEFGQRQNLIDRVRHDCCCGLMNHRRTHFRPLSLVVGAGDFLTSCTSSSRSKPRPPPMQ